MQATVSEQFHLVNGLRTFSRVRGEGPDLVLVHGVGVSSAYWVPTQRCLAAAGYRAWALDLPGFGRSVDAPWRPQLPRYADHLLAWLDVALPGRRSTLIGQSLGCEISTLAAAAEPWRFDRLILAAPSGMPHLNSVTKQLLQAAVDAPRESLALFRTIIPDYFRCGALRVFQMLWEQKRLSFEETLRRVRQPALVLRGVEDPIVIGARAQAVAALLAHSRTATVPGAHAAHYTHPLAFVDAVEAFLASLGEQRRAA